MSKLELWPRFARLICWCVCRMCFRLRYYGLENVPQEGGLLLASNHQSFLDPILCGIKLKRVLCFLARDTLFENKVFGRLLRSVNAIPVKRGQGDTAAMKAVIDKLNQGKGVCLFPEGTRSLYGRISELKPGFALLCQRGHAAILPTIVDGAFECWPKDRKWPKLGSEIRICYGSAITADQVKQANPRELAIKLTEILRKMQNDCRKAQGKEVFEY